MLPFCENVVMPYSFFPIKSFLSSTMVHVIEAHPHWHAEIEVLYFIKGSARQQINETIFIAECGDIVFIGKNQIHSTYSFGKNDCEILVMQFNSEQMLGSDGNISIIHPYTHLIEEVIFINPIKSDTKAGKMLYYHINEIHQELTNKEVAYESMAKAALHRIAGILARYRLFEITCIDLVKMKNIRKMLENTFRLIDEAYSEEITLNRAAQVSNLSVTHFCRLFKEATGMTFNDYITFYRVNHAIRLLNSSKKMTEIALECGFGSISSFIRSFKKYKSCAPSKYMQMK